MESFISGYTSPAEINTGCARIKAVKALYEKSRQVSASSSYWFPVLRGSMADSAGCPGLTLENVQLFSQIRCVQTRRQHFGQTPACAWLDQVGTAIEVIAMEIKYVKYKLILMFWFL